jgi:hypothetical protein
MMVSGIDLFAKRAKLSLFFSLFRMFNATMFDAVPIGVAIPPIPGPTAGCCHWTVQYWRISIHISGL